eukprot:CAMPEP_0206253100 /NCGR_PEP_ID=MMETSP0047_2-20121206/22971_1 /ASSEMBLY_ACC=CAM_ASM_000192 /TAXON_ID=195065 /ORGANISM="Chroomonas mesostigmatica_cf, Strain CCMP1168" /LENGTH=59 /DNA_ID=CAMNT_0053679285 /DNA_START=191 /DNA_END=366 /DNA_ORIENTATION=-
MKATPVRPVRPSRSPAPKLLFAFALIVTLPALGWLGFSASRGRRMGFEVDRRLEPPFDG